MRSFFVLLTIIVFPIVTLSQRLLPLSEIIVSTLQENPIHTRSSINDISIFNDQVFVLEQDRYCHKIDIHNGETSIWLTSEDRSARYNILTTYNDAPAVICGYHKILGLYEEDEKPVVFSSANLQKTVEPTTIIKSTNGAIYIGTKLDGLFVFEANKSDQYSHVPRQHSIVKGALPSSTIQSVFEDSAGNIWVGTNLGIAKITTDSVYNLNPIRKTNLLQSLFSRQAKKQKPLSVQSFAQWGDQLIIGSSDGIFSLPIDAETSEGLIPHRLEEIFELPMGEISDLLVDNNGNLWVAADHLIRFNQYNESLILYSAYPNYRAKHANVLTENPADGAIWIGTERGGLYMVEGNWASQIQKPPVTSSVFSGSKG